MNQFKNRNVRIVFILSALLIVLLTNAVANLILFTNYKFTDAILGIAGWLLFLAQLTVAVVRTKRQYINGEIPILNPRILKYRASYGKVRFILLADFINLRLTAIVVILMIFYNNPFDISWWLYFTNLVILLFIKLFVGNMIWKKYGEFVSIEKATLGHR